MAEQEKDFMDHAVDEWLGRGAEPIPPGTPAAPVEPDEPALPPVETPEPLGETPKETPSYDPLAEFNKATGLNFDSIDKVKDFADKYSKYPEIEEQVKLLPELVNALESVQNPLNFFKDEIAYKVAMVTKEGKYQGKEAVINEILRGDLSSLDDIKIIGIAASLKASPGVRSPLRAELRGMNIDPDVVIDGYEDLDDDTKDLLKIRADQYRDELSKVGEGIKPPSFEGTVVEQLLNQKRNAKEDYASKLTKILPVAKGIISEIKEMKVTDDFSFKLDLSPDQVNSYSDELAEILASGQYDISTDDGKSEVYGAIMDMFKADFFDKAVAALKSHTSSHLEEEWRRKFNNEVPLDKKEPNPLTEKEEKDLITRTAERMVSVGY